MENNSANILELIVVIVNYGVGSKVLKIAKQNGISGGAIFYGKGTVKNKLLEFLEIHDIRKEIVLMISDHQTKNTVMEVMDKELHLSKPYHGIAFTIPISGLYGTRRFADIEEAREGGKMNYMYQSIYAIVDKGNGETVMDAATAAGAKGGTIINARGSGIHETSKLFHMDIEPEKEIVLILSENDLTDSIVASIREKLEIDKPGNGIIFTQNVAKTYGVIK